jgi:hypothetical protein
VFKGGDKVARGRIPELSAVVSACRQDPSTVWTERRLLDLVLMFKGGYGFARSRIPKLDGLIVARRQDSSTVQAESRVEGPAPRFSKEAMSLPEAASQSLAVLSLPAVRIRAPSALNAACKTSS